MEKTIGDYKITDDPRQVDIESTHNLLRQTYWAKGRSKETVEKSVMNSICFSLTFRGKQVGIARAITDHATYTSILDLVIEEGHRGKGLGKEMVQFIMEHPEIKNTKKILWTKDAEGLYERCGFRPNPDMKVLFHYPEEQPQLANMKQMIKLDESPFNGIPS